MYQVRIHGRRGQGLATTVELLSLAAFRAERWAQVFPGCGMERAGAPVVSFCRIDDNPIRLRDPIIEPDTLIINDPTLLHRAPVFDGMLSTTYLLINTTQSLNDLGIEEFTRILPPEHAIAVPATELAIQHLGRPLPAAALLVRSQV